MSDINKPDIESLKVHQALGGSVSASEILAAHTSSIDGEIRPAQETMASAVEETIAGKKTLLVQAGTGTGKSLAYISGIVAAGKGRSVIATSTNQLSDQLLLKDLPAMEKTAKELKKDITFAALKGRNNYACLAKIAQIETENLEADNRFNFDDPAEINAKHENLKVNKAKRDSEALNQILEWSKSTESGERTEAPPSGENVWRQVSVSSSQCPGASKCPFGEPCFAERARRKAKKADLIVTNHAMLAQHAIPTATDSGIDLFGKIDNIIIDEAHNLPASLTSALSFQINESQLRDLYKSLNRISMTSELTHMRELEENLEIFGVELTKLPPKRIMGHSVGFIASARELVKTLLVMQKALLKISKSLSASGNDQENIARTEIALSELESTIYRINITAQDSVEDNVQWAEPSGNGGEMVLNVAPLDISVPFQNLTNGLSVIGTSATLKTGESFAPIINTLGLQGAQTLDVGSPFEYKKQGILYIPDESFPAPVGSERTEHTIAVKEELKALVEASGGRALCLFTTTRAAQDAAEFLRAELPHLNVLSHGDAAADILVQEFREDETSVLCATMGMWQGTDVPGPSCSLVVIDKIPFPTPDDILNQARSEKAAQNGRNGFYEVSVSHAAINLAQGSGRLIRTQSDQGVVAILDNRIITKQYGKTILASLPEFTRISERDKVLAALSRLASKNDKNISQPSFKPKPKPSQTKPKTYAQTPNSKKNVPVSSRKTRQIGKR